MQGDKPPFLGKWRNVYLLLVAMLALMIVVLNIITRYFS
jgi:hypothetical protein